MGGGGSTACSAARSAPRHAGGPPQHAQHAQHDPTAIGTCVEGPGGVGVVLVGVRRVLCMLAWGVMAPAWGVLPAGTAPPPGIGWPCFLYHSTPTATWSPQVVIGT